MHNIYYVCKYICNLMADTVNDPVDSVSRDNVVQVSKNENCKDHGPSNVSQELIDKSG